MTESSEYAKVQTIGRKTGRAHSVEVRFALLDGSVFALTGEVESDWARNALASGDAKVTIGNLVYKTNARVATDSEATEAIKAFEKKYGAKAIDRWYSTSKTCIRFEPVGQPTPALLPKGEFDVSKTLAEWKKSNRDYYREVATAFDSASAEYDFTISKNFVNTWIRRRSIEKVLEYAKPEDILVEVGCGTGVEAIAISMHVAQVVATDLSPRMIGLLRRKVAQNPSARVTPLELKASRIADVANLLPNGKTKLAYSFNGALNCELDLAAFVEGLASILEPGGRFICSIRNSFCLTESLVYLFALRPERATPRKRQPMLVSVGGTELPSIYYSTLEFPRFFEDHFSVEEKMALPALLPPAYLSEYYVRVRQALSPIERIDQALGKHFPLNMWGDQTLFVFQRRS